MPVPIAVVAAACEFPGARTPDELWQIALHGRWCFRRLPPQRLALSDYAGAEGDPDSIYPIEAGLIEGYRFDRSRFKVPRASYAVTDMAHWLALDVADRALSQLPSQWRDQQDRKDRMAVVVANTLTGEFSRANLLRYRWPFVQRRLRAAAGSRWPGGELDALVRDFEQEFKRPFPAPDEDSLAGGLSNTIAGRIANHFGLRGGAYAADGACASSLVAVVTACDRLASGDVDGVLVCAVDLSLDPFELVGFARNGAMARSAMRVFDRESQGFWPGEGCACVVLAREETASEMDWPVLGWIRGVGMSTDGQGGLTRPTQSGQLLAQRRAWAHAGLDPASVDYIEAHGTGTPTGDPIELRALAELIGSARGRRGAVPVGSIKANIGHTKAAAGLAGMLKALTVVRLGIIPPTSGCVDPHPVWSEAAVKRAVRIAQRAQALAGQHPLTAGINGFGFGGVNCHVVVQGPARARARGGPSGLPRYVEGRLAGELVLLSGRTRQELADRIAAVARRARLLARGELVDLAASLLPDSRTPDAWRACVVADSPQQLEQRCDALSSSLRSASDAQRELAEAWSWSAPAARPPVLGFLFPGQGLQSQVHAGPWIARFPVLAGPLRALLQPQGSDDTSEVQPRLATMAVAALELLSAFGLVPTVALGHSFGELSAWHAAGAFDVSTFYQLARTRGRAMQDYCAPSAMLAVECDRAMAQSLASRHGLDIACHNAPQRQVLAGSVDNVLRAVLTCAANAIPGVRLPTQRAFHSRLMLTAQSRFAAAVAQVPFARPHLSVVSSVTGDRPGDALLADILVRQFIEPVRFEQAVRALGPVDLLLELGNGSQLGQLVAEIDGPLTLTIAMAGPSLQPLLGAVGAAWVVGAAVRTDPLVAGRLVRAFALTDEPVFLTSPCGVGDDPETAATAATAAPTASKKAIAGLPQLQQGRPVAGEDRTAIEVLRSVVCDLTELAIDHVPAQARLLADLHLNSIRARHAVAMAARQLGITSLPFNPGELANARLEDIAEHLERLRCADPRDAPRSDGRITGIARWVRVLTYAWQDCPRVLPSGRYESVVRMVLDDSCMPMPAAWRAQWAHRLVADAGAPILLLLPAMGDERVLQTLFQRVREMVAGKGPVGMLVVQRGQLANAYLLSVSQEHPALRLAAVQCDPTDVVQMALAFDLYASRMQGYSELRLDGAQTQQRVAVPLSLAPAVGQWAPGRSDLMLISGGARGIGAVSAIWLAQRFGCPMVLIGRSPAQDAEVATTMAQIRASGSEATYLQLDLADAQATHAALRNVQQDLGPVRALVHAAGINHPCAVRELDWQTLHDTWRAKVYSLDNVLSALAQPLRWLIGYSSVIGAFGLRGEAHYALANEWLIERLLCYAAAVPSARVLPLCWTAWRETGMAKRMPDVLEQLDAADVDAIDSDTALAQLDAVMGSELAGQALLITGRYGRVVDPLRDLQSLQRHRFLEWPRLWYPGVELVADAQVSVDSDPYLLGHAPGGVVVLPLVVAIEAMVSAAQCLGSTAAVPALHDLRVGEAISWVDGETQVLRTLALAQADGSVQLALRCSASGFAVDHFAARLEWSPAMLGRDRDRDQGQRPVASDPPDALAAADLLYRGLAFHGLVYQRVGAYGHVNALHCAYRVDAAALPRWYAALLPAGMAMGHPVIRDAVLQGLQASVPHHQVLPTGVKRLVLGPLRPDCAYTVLGRQVSGDGQDFVFDIDVFDQSGRLVEQWTGLHLVRLASDHRMSDAWLALDPALLEAYVGRLLHDGLRLRDCAVGVAASGRLPDASCAAVRRALGPQAVLSHLADGTPIANGHVIGVAHADRLTLCVAHPDIPIGCDIETDSAGFASADTSLLMLGLQRADFAQALARRDALAPMLAALAVWSATECLLKLGRSDWPFVLDPLGQPLWCRTGPIWTWQEAGWQVVVGMVRLADEPSPSMVAVAHGPLRAAPSDVLGRGQGQASMATLQPVGA